MICLNCGCKIDLGAKFCPFCGSPTKLSDEENTGKLTIIREKKTMAFAISFEVYVDNSRLGSLKNNSELSCDLPFGEHEVIVKSIEKDVLQNITLNENQKNAEIHIVPKMGLISANPHIKEIKYN